MICSNFFTYCKNGDKLPVTMGKSGNYYLPMGKNSVYQLGFLKVKLNFQWSSPDSPATRNGNFKNYQKNYCTKNNCLLCSTWWITGKQSKLWQSSSNCEPRFKSLVEGWAHAVASLVEGWAHVVTCDDCLVGSAVCHDKFKKFITSLSSHHCHHIIKSHYWSQRSIWGYFTGVLLKPILMTNLLQSIKNMSILKSLKTPKNT